MAATEPAGDGAHLLAQAGLGERDAMRALLEQYGPQVSATIDQQIGQAWRAAIDVDDVMQVTYLEAFLQAQQMTAREPRSFIAWLRRIAENNLRDAIKELQRAKRPDPRRRVQPAASADLDNSYVALVELLGATTTTPSRGAAGRETRQLLDLALAQLPPAYRTVIKLYDLEGRPIQEVADAVKRSPGAVHMLRARAHDRLRSLLGTSTNFFSDAG